MTSGVLLFLCLEVVFSTGDFYLTNEFGNGALRVTGLSNDNLDFYSERRLNTNETYFVSDVFENYPYDYKKYPPFSAHIGSDEISMLGSSLSNNEHYSVSGSYGYNIFEGRVSVYSMISKYKWGLHSELKSPIAGNINFGVSVNIAADQNIIIIGANSYGFYAGVAFTYQLAIDNSTWALTGSIQSPSGANSGFGSQVKIDGQHAMVATFNKQAFIYERQTNNKYSLVSSLTVDGAVTSISLSGGHAAVGVESFGGSIGQVYVYLMDGADHHVWRLHTVIPSAGGLNSYFGHSISVGNHTLVVGAPGKITDPFVGGSPPADISNNNGTVFVYDLQKTHHNGSETSQWVLTQRLNSSLGQNDCFGSAVDMSLDQEIVVGASGFPNGTAHGSAFVYIRDYNMTWVNDTMPPNNWVMQYALPSTTGKKSSFGSAISIAPGLVLVGAYGTNDLQGSLSLVAHDQTFPPPRRHTSSPTMAPTQQDAEKFSGGAGNLGVLMNTGTIVAVVVAGLLGLFLAGLLYYCKYVANANDFLEEEELRRIRLQMEQDELDAKEKERARNTDDNYYDEATSRASGSAYGDGAMAYSEDFRSSYDDGSEGVSDLLSMSLRGTLEQDGNAKKKGDKEGVKTHMTETELRKKFPYKVHSYAGYQEEQFSTSLDGGSQLDNKMAKDREAMKNEQHDSDSVSDNHGASHSGMSVISHDQSTSSMDTTNSGRQSAMSVATARILEYKRAINQSRGGFVDSEPAALSAPQHLKTESRYHDPNVYIDRTGSLDVHGAAEQRGNDPQHSHDAVKRLVDNATLTHLPSPLSVGHVFSSDTQTIGTAEAPTSGGFHTNHFTNSNPLREVEAQVAPLVDVLRGNITLSIPSSPTSMGRSAGGRGPLSPENKLGTPLNADQTTSSAPTPRAGPQRTPTVSSASTPRLTQSVTVSKAAQSYQAFRAKQEELQREQQQRLEEEGSVVSDSSHGQTVSSGDSAASSRAAQSYQAYKAKAAEMERQRQEQLRAEEAELLQQHGESNGELKVEGKEKEGDKA